MRKIFFVLIIFVTLFALLNGCKAIKHLSQMEHGEVYHSNRPGGCCH